MKTLKELGTLDLHTRDIMPGIAPWLKEHEAIVISGGRRTGKSSLMYLLGQLVDGPTHFLDVEVPEDRDVVAAGPDALEHVTGGGTVFVDEIQYLPDFPSFVKLCVDHHPHLKLVVSGSSSLALARGFSDELVGRIATFDLSVLSFREYLGFRGQGALAAVKPPQGTVLPQVDRLFNEYLLYGGYPRIATLETDEMKAKYLSDLIRVYARRDVDALFKTSGEIAFERFVHTVSVSAGSMVNASKIAHDIGVSDKTAARYLAILQQLYLVYLVPPLAGTVRSEIKRAQKLYFCDTGLLNWARGSFSPMDQRGDAGALAENYAFLALQRSLRPGERLHYWRKKSGAEVDFVVADGSPLPVEVKWSENPAPEAGFASFIKEHKPERATVLTRGVTRSDSIDSIPVTYRPLQMLEL
jgi:predicted AAA+ superfamily ATPase